MKSLRAPIRLAVPAVLCLGLLAPSCRDELPAAGTAGEPGVEVVATKKEAAPLVVPAPEPAAPEPAPAAEPTPPPAAGDAGPLVAENGASIADLVVAKGVEKRKPVEPGTSFAAPGPIRLYAIFDVMNPERVEGELSVSWLAPDGNERGRVSLSYPGQPRWRTWAFHSHIAKPGHWEAIVRTADGQELGRAPFDVTP
jgi:hypothetical protein